MAEVILHTHMSSPSPEAAIFPSGEVSSTNNCDGTDSQGDSDQKMVEDVAERPEPLKDIKGDFTALLKHDFKFPATYVYYKNYDVGSIPNPCLKIDGLGFVGLPLSERDAKAIISRVTQVGSGTREISSNNVHIINAAWDKWVRSTVVSRVCDALGIEYSQTSPECELYKLLIQEPGLECSSYKDDKRSPRNFGTISIILPSEFTGGQLDLCDQGWMKEVDFAQNKTLSTSVLGSYTGLTHNLKPIHSGYKIVLCYNLIHASNGICPSLPDMQGPIDKLRHMLLLWKQAINRPKQLAYVFKRRYSNSDLSMDVFADSDASILYLLPVARSLHFRLYLANIELQTWDYDNGNIEGKNEKIYVTHVVDLDNIPFRIHGLALDRKKHLFGEADLDGPMSAKPDVTKYAGHDSYYGKRLTDFHRRTVLLIWPENEELKVTVGDVYEHARDALELSFSIIPEGKERALVDHLMDYCANQVNDDEQLSRALRVLRETAVRWNDAPLLLRAAKACKADVRIDLIGVEGFISVYQAFSFERMKTLFSDVIKNDGSNLLRWQLVHRLEEAGLEAGDKEVRTWCSDHQGKILRSLKSVTPEQVDWLVSQVKSRGIEFLCDVIVPQLQTLNAGQNFSVPFLRQLYLEQDSFGPSSALRWVLTQLVTHLLHNAPPFPVFPVKKQWRYRRNRDPDIDINSSMELIKLAVDTANVNSCSAGFARMRAVARDQPLEPVIPVFYSGMITRLNGYLTPELRSLLVFREFFRDAIVLQLENLLAIVDFKAFTDAVKAAGGVPFLKESLTPRIYAMVEKSSEVVVALVRSIASSLRPPKSDGPATHDFQEILTLCLSALIDHLELQPGVYRTAYDHINLVGLCLEIDIPSLCERLFLRLLDPPGIDIQVHIAKVLVPFVPVLQGDLAKLDSNLTAEPFAQFCSQVIQKFVKVVLGPRPPRESVRIPSSELGRLECKDRCSHCREFRKFLESSREEMSFRKGQEIRNHVEHRVDRSYELGITCATIRVGNPHTLKISKPAGIALRIWREQVQQGNDLMDVLGDENQRRQILGDDYAWVMAALPPEGGQTSAGSAASSSSIPVGQKKRPLRAARESPDLSEPAEKRARTSID